MKSDIFFESFVELLNYEQSYSTLDGKRVIDTTKRSSKICTKKFTTKFPDELRNFCNMCKIFIPENLVFTLYKYEAGDFFAKHTDRSREKLHKYTLLLFPPCSEMSKNYFEGGDLLIGKTRIKCNSIEKYTYLIFNIDIEHELEPILTGTRYVFKSYLNVIDDDIIPNSFPFSKTIHKIFNIDVVKDMNINTNISRIGDLNLKTIFDFDLPINKESKKELQTTIIDTSANLFESDPSVQWLSDYDDGYYRQPEYRRGLYLRNKINKRLGKSMLRD